MKNLFFATIYAFTVIGTYSCSADKSKPSTEGRQATETAAVKTEEIGISDVEGYFSIQKVEEPTVVLLDESNFDKYFHPAKTMTNLPTVINFEEEMAVGIILPETPYPTTIVINRVTLSGEVLNVDFAVNKGADVQTFTIRPSKVFSFSSRHTVGAVVFNNGKEAAVTP